MRARIIILFFLICRIINGQTDTLRFENGRVPENVFIKGYSFQKTNSGALIRDKQQDFNPGYQDFKIYYSKDSTGYSGVALFIKNKETPYGQSHSSFDEFECYYQQGKKEYCEKITYIRNNSEQLDGQKFAPWISKVERTYHSLPDGNGVDSIDIWKYSNTGHLERYSHYFSENEKQIELQTFFRNNDTIYHGRKIDGLFHGKWLISIELFNEDKQVIDSTLVFYCVFEYGRLVNVLDDSCLFLGKKNEILDKATFFNRYPNLMFGIDYEFLAMHNQSHIISNEHKIILTVNKNNFFDGIPEKSLKKIIKRFKKSKFI